MTGRTETGTPLHRDTVQALAVLLDIAAGWLDKAGLTDEAATARALPPVVDLTSLDGAWLALLPMQTVAYRASGVTVWPQATAGFKAVDGQGGLDAKNAAGAPYGWIDCIRGRVSGLASVAYTIAVYAAQAAARRGDR